MYEDNQVKNKVYEAMKALKKNKFASFRGDQVQYNKPIVYKGKKDKNIVRSQSETKASQIVLQKKLQALQSIKALSQMPKLKKNTSKSQRAKIEERALHDEHLKLKSLKTVVFMKDESRFDKETHPEKFKELMN